MHSFSLQQEELASGKRVLKSICWRFVFQPNVRKNTNEGLIELRVKFKNVPITSSDNPACCSSDKKSDFSLVAEERVQKLTSFPRCVKCQRVGWLLSWSFTTDAKWNWKTLHICQSRSHLVSEVRRRWSGVVCLVLKMLKYPLTLLIVWIKKQILLKSSIFREVFFEFKRVPNLENKQMNLQLSILNFQDSVQTLKHSLVNSAYTENAYLRCQTRWRDSPCGRGSTDSRRRILPP